MLPTVVYKKFCDVIVLYRCSYNTEVKWGVDELKRGHIRYNNIEHPYDDFLGYVIKDGAILHSDSQKTMKSYMEFFGFGECEKDETVVTLDLNACFAGNGNVVFYKANLPTPKRIVKTFKTQSKTVIRWLGKSYVKQPSYEVKMWDFKSDKDFIICPLTDKLLFNIVPYDFENGLGEEYHNMMYGGDIINGLNRRQEFYDKLYQMSPVPLSGSYDYTKEQKKYINKCKQLVAEETARREEELERLKNTPGHCQYCGAANASYVPNPFDEEIYDATNYEWICDRCFSDLCGDV